MTALTAAYEQSPVRKLNILLVDDHEPSGKIEGALLRELGHTYDIVVNGLEALKKFSENSYDLVFLDLQMPGIDGLETARRMREFEKSGKRPATPIIGMTGRATEDDKMLCLKAGMDDYLSKPFRLSELETKIFNFSVNAPA